MFVRLEKLQKSNSVLIIDEVGKFIGEIDETEFILNCMSTTVEPIKEDDYVYVFVDKECLKKYLL